MRVAHGCVNIYLILTNPSNNSPLDPPVGQALCWMGAGVPASHMGPSLHPWGAQRVGREMMSREKLIKCGQCQDTQAPQMESNQGGRCKGTCKGTVSLNRAHGDSIPGRKATVQVSLGITLAGASTAPALAVRQMRWEELSINPNTLTPPHSPGRLLVSYVTPPPPPFMEEEAQVIYWSWHS